MEATSNYPNLKPWQPGQSGNLNGRPVGSRSAFSAGFTRDLAEVWAEKGKTSMLCTAEKQPAVFFATCARLLPNDVRVTVEAGLPGGLDPGDWALLREVIEAVRQALPNAADRRPGAVLEHVLDALRQAEARTNRQFRKIRTVLFAPTKILNDINDPILQPNGEITRLRILDFRIGGMLLPSFHRACAQWFDSQVSA